MLPDDVAISVRNLSKTYRLFGHPGDRIKQFFSLGLKQYHREFTALKDISFEIKKGETVGIIGRNGSGKSTLLQLICGILQPTSGSVEVNGRVSALLELGAGFNPEFTGRENVYFQGALLGFTQAQIEERFEDIAAFADIGEFIDQPVRTYSSGMFVRLAFAVAVHVDPDILVIDEALAVGDMLFQRKCFQRLATLTADPQRVLILVSHDLRQISRVCARTLLLQEGGLLADGHSHKVCGQAGEINYGDLKQMAQAAQGERARIETTGEVDVLSAHIVGADGGVVEEVLPGAPLCIRIHFLLREPLVDAELIVGTQTIDLQTLSASSTRQVEPNLRLLAGEHMVEYSLPNLPLAPGQYCVRFAVRDRDFRVICYAEGLSPFSVRADAREFDRPPRLLDLEANWHWLRMADAPEQPVANGDSC